MQEYQPRGLDFGYCYVVGIKPELLSQISFGVRETTHCFIATKGRYAIEAYRLKMAMEANLPWITNRQLSVSVMSPDKAAQYKAQLFQGKNQALDRKSYESDGEK